MYPEDDNLWFDEPDEDLEKDRGISLITKLVILVLVLALLVTLIWPLLHYRTRQFIPPTPTPSFLLEA